MECVRNEHGLVFRYNGLLIAHYSEYHFLAIGGKLQLYSRHRDYKLCYCSGGRGFSITEDDREEYEWVTEFHKAIRKYGDKVVIDSELSDKCLNLRNLLEYRYETSLNNIYDGDIIEIASYGFGNRLSFGSNNITIKNIVYMVSDNFMAKALLSNKIDVVTAIHAERDEIWRSAFPPKVKSALSHSDYN